MANEVINRGNNIIQKNRYSHLSAHPINYFVGCSNNVKAKRYVFTKLCSHHQLFPQHLFTWVLSSLTIITYGKSWIAFTIYFIIYWGKKKFVTRTEIEWFLYVHKHKFQLEGGSSRKHGLGYSESGKYSAVSVPSLLLFLLHLMVLS